MNNAAESRRMQNNQKKKKTPNSHATHPNKNNAKPSIRPSSTMTPHPLHPTPNIALRLLRRILPHIPPEFLQLAFFGLDSRDADALAHLAAHGFGLAGGAHGRMGVVGRWWVVF